MDRAIASRMSSMLKLKVKFCRKARYSRAVHSHKKAATRISHGGFMYGLHTFKPQPPVSAATSAAKSLSSFFSTPSPSLNMAKPVISAAKPAAFAVSATKAATV